VFAVVFPIFFGLMLADFGYGIVILGISLWMIANFPGRQYVPKKIKNFLKMIMPPSGMRSLAYALVPGCILAIVLGVAFNAFFGAQVIPGYHSPVDPLKHVGPLLKIAGFVGIGMVVFGFSLGALKEYFHHRPRHTLGPDGHGGLIGGSAGVVLIPIGVLILVVGQGFNLVLGVFEPGIQGARLIFVEYFSKFYTGNGREFRPLRSARKHTAPAIVVPAPAK
jgi:V/A-type H+-transporting ATPase subunit I